MKFEFDEKYAKKLRDEERYAELFQYASKGADVGDAVAQYWVGECFRQGLHVDRDSEKAHKYYEMSAEKKYAPSIRAIGLLADDVAESARLLRQAAELGDADAQCDLGDAYSGLFELCEAVGGQNEKEAFRWYKLAAEQGHATAQRNLGYCYFRGEGVPKDKKEAAKWWKSAAEQGDEDVKSQFDGVTKDSNKDDTSKEMLRCKCNESEPYIFASYSHKDSSQVHKIISKIHEEGYNIWFDEGIDPGTEWDENIAAHIKKAGFFIAFISKNYLESSNCKDELNYARDLNIERLIVYLEEAELPAGMKMRLGRLQAIHYATYNNQDDFYDKLFSTKKMADFSNEFSDHHNDASKAYLTIYDQSCLHSNSDSHSRAVPVLFLVDTSGSMFGDRIQKTNDTINLFILRARKVATFEREIMLSIISFGSQAEIALPFTPVTSIPPSVEFSLKAGGLTSFGSALKKAKVMIEKGLQEICYCPTVVLISDGFPTDDWENPMNDFINTGKSAKCHRLVMSMCDDDDWNDQLKRFAQNEESYFTDVKSENIWGNIDFITCSVHDKNNLFYDGQKTNSGDDWF